MAKKQRNNKPRKNRVKQTPVESKPSNTRLYFGGALALAAIVIGYTWWSGNQAEAAFLDLARSGEPRLDKVQSPRNLGRGHLRPGQSYHYPSRYPTSGPHDVVWTRPGFYDLPQSPLRLVHALEHGHIVIYYDKPSPEVRQTLEAWTELYGVPWQGVVASPMPALEQKIILTAWTKRLDMDTFDPAAAAAFIERYRGRGPENPVR